MVAGPCFSLVGAGVTELTVLMALAEACPVLPTLYGGSDGTPLICLRLLAARERTRGPCDAEVVAGQTRAHHMVTRRRRGRHC